ncbi:hypothetical protein H1R20_g3352, partial [Candolleomyces eurysporus]
MTKFATTLACQLAAAIPEVAPLIENALHRLVYEPFKAAVKLGRLLKCLLKGPFLVVIDGLDECEDRENVIAFIDDMFDFFKKNPLVPLRFLITSRVEQHIQGRLRNSDQVRLEDLVDHCSRDDIDTFMDTCFEAENSRNPVVQAFIQEHGEWPTKADKDQLVDHINGSFIFASALFKYIVDPTNDQSTPMDRLPHTLNMNPGLDTLYTQTLSRSQHLPHFPDIMSTIALLVEPLPIVGIAELLGIECFEVVRVLSNLQAIVHIPGVDDLPVTLCHTSFRDFLTTESRSRCFFAPPSYHLHLLYRCSILHERRQSGTAAALYSVKHCEDHLKQCICLTTIAQGPAPLFPQTLDALYALVLPKAQDLPRFFEIISTIAIMNSDPPSIFQIAKRIRIESSEVSRVLVTLNAIIPLPTNAHSPVTCHTPLRDFLTTEIRSGPFFVSPLRRLQFCYRAFMITFHLWLDGNGRSNHHLWALERVDYLAMFLREVPESNVVDALEEFTHLSSEPLPYRHLFSFSLLLFWVLCHRPRQVWRILIKCAESLALALECDPEPLKWLSGTFNDFGFLRATVAERVCLLKIDPEQAVTLQGYVERAEMVIGIQPAFRYHSPLNNPSPFTSDEFDAMRWLGEWSINEAFRWVVTHVQSATNLVRPGIACNFDLHTVGVPCTFLVDIYMYGYASLRLAGYLSFRQQA